MWREFIRGERFITGGVSVTLDGQPLPWGLEVVAHFPHRPRGGAAGARGTGHSESRRKRLPPPPTATAPVVDSTPLPQTTRDLPEAVHLAAGGLGAVDPVVR